MGKIKYVILSVVLMVTIAIAYGIPDRSPAVAAQKTQKWEYWLEHLVIPLKLQAIPEVLKRRGNEGWELVTVTEERSIIRLYFKRPK